MTTDRDDDDDDDDDGVLIVNENPQTLISPYSPSSLSLSLY